eukprot:TRINITY_DN26338_c0_g1_i1.p1 TRINITY_DN26338_c0_g1~~TRINITY_DN26338_c0_g1_i1.p1  ORF type:complete len:847 (+),score=161.57 TRINITY_DN26338_c0_g1_i1:65-2542(+)
MYHERLAALLGEPCPGASKLLGSPEDTSVEWESSISSGVVRTLRAKVDATVKQGTSRRGASCKLEVWAEDHSGSELAFCHATILDQLAKGRVHWLGRSNQQEVHPRVRGKRCFCHGGSPNCSEGDLAQKLAASQMLTLAEALLGLVAALMARHFGVRTLELQAMDNGSGKLIKFYANLGFLRTSDEDSAPWMEAPVEAIASLSPERWLDDLVPVTFQGCPWLMDRRQFQQQWYTLKDLVCDPPSFDVEEPAGARLEMTTLRRGLLSQAMHQQVTIQAVLRDSVTAEELVSAKSSIMLSIDVVRVHWWGRSGSRAAHSNVRGLPMLGCQGHSRSSEVRGPPTTTAAVALLGSLAVIAHDLGIGFLEMQVLDDGSGRLLPYLQKLGFVLADKEGVKLPRWMSVPIETLAQCCPSSWLRELTLLKAGSPSRSSQAGDQRPCSRLFQMPHKEGSMKASSGRNRPEEHKHVSSKQCERQFARTCAMHESRIVSRTGLQPTNSETRLKLERTAGTKASADAEPMPPKPEKNDRRPQSAALEESGSSQLRSNSNISSEIACSPGHPSPALACAAARDSAEQQLEEVKPKKRHRRHPSAARQAVLWKLPCDSGTGAGALQWPSSGSVQEAATSSTSCPPTQDAADSLLLNPLDQMRLSSHTRPCSRRRRSPTDSLAQASLAGVSVMEDAELGLQKPKKMPSRPPSAPTGPPVCMPVEIDTCTRPGEHSMGMPCLVASASTSTCATSMDVLDNVDPSTKPEKASCRSSLAALQPSRSELLAAPSASQEHSQQKAHAPPNSVLKAGHVSRTPLGPLKELIQRRMRETDMYWGRLE